VPEGDTKNSSNPMALQTWSTNVVISVHESCGHGSWGGIREQKTPEAM
jgi:hypothetical protein